MRKLAFTEHNEAMVREFLFAKWEVYYARRRWEHLQSMRIMKPGTDEYEDLASTRYVRAPAPFDLSGACKIAAQLSVKLFALDGEVISNRRHTFVLLSSGRIYDFNRHCRDVNSMLIQQRRPYEINHTFNQSKEAVRGRQSWRHFITEFMVEFADYLSAKRIVLYHRGPQVKELPAWAQRPPAPITSFPHWEPTLKEVQHA